MKRIFVDVKKCLGCKTCEIICSVKHSKSGNLFKAIKEQPGPQPRMKVVSFEIFSLPIQCRHCVEPACLEACISGAIEVKDDLVIINKNRCVHCYSCVMSCPYGLMQVDRRENVAVKCDLCPEDEVPPCVNSCPTKALFYGEITDFEIVKKKRNEKCSTL